MASFCGMYISVVSEIPPLPFHAMNGIQAMRLLIKLKYNGWHSSWPRLTVKTWAVFRSSIRKKIEQLILFLKGTKSDYELDKFITHKHTKDGQNEQSFPRTASLIYIISDAMRCDAVAAFLRILSYKSFRSVHSWLFHFTLLWFFYPFSIIQSLRFRLLL